MQSSKRQIHPLAGCSLFTVTQPSQSFLLSLPTDTAPPPPHPHPHPGPHWYSACLHTGSHWNSELYRLQGGGGWGMLLSLTLPGTMTMKGSFKATELWRGSWSSLNLGSAHIPRFIVSHWVGVGRSLTYSIITDSRRLGQGRPLARLIV